MGCAIQENRTRGLFDPASDEPYKLSRSKVELFLRCPRCFYLDRRLGISEPSDFIASLHLAVDELLKREFDMYRVKGEAHPYMIAQSIDAIPLKHPSLDEWRDPNRGVQYVYKPANLLLYGAIDDVWMNTRNQMNVVDYKATSTTKDFPINGPWMLSNHRQLEFYQWLLRHQGYDVSDIGYLVYVNGNRNKDTFDSMLEFHATIVPYRGTNDWIEDALLEIRTCLEKTTLPMSHPSCATCEYRRKAAAAERA
jgi:CRISPR/Cas system-associated exonuclease Cas4 (RecB family)